MIGLMVVLVLPACAIVLGSLWLSAWWGRRNGWPVDHVLWASVTLAGLGGIALMCLGREAALPRWNPDGLRDLSMRGWWRLLEDPWSVQSLANVALFVPFTLGLTMLIRRPVGGLLAGWMLSVLVEVAQGLLALGLPDVADVVTNGAGSVLGASAGAALILGGHMLGRRQSRWRIVECVGLLGATVLAFGAAGLWSEAAAQRQQSDLVAHLDQLFSTTTITDYRQWESDDRMDEHVFERLSGTRADGAQDSPLGPSVRWPASVGGARRCVVVTWPLPSGGQPSGPAQVRAISGERCAAVRF